MAERDYDSFAEDCPDLIMVIIRGKSAKLIDVCGHVLPELVSDVGVGEFEWKDEVDGIFVLDVEIENEQWMTDCGYEYDVNWWPNKSTPITDEMWERFVAEEHVWPDEYYALKEEV